MAEAEDVDALMNRMDQLQTDIDAVDGWEIDRQLDRAMDALRCPPGVPPLLPRRACKTKIAHYLAQMSILSWYQVKFFNCCHVLVL